MRSAGTLLRSTWRLASALRAELLAVAVVPRGTPAGAAGALQRNLELAEELGGAVRIVEGLKVAPAVAALLKTENAAMLVIGHRPAGRRLWNRSLIDELLALVDNVGVYLVETPDAARDR